MITSNKSGSVLAGRFRFAGMVVSVIGLSACAAFQPEQPILSTPSDQQALYRLDEWRLQGRVAVRTAEDTWHASLNWQHNPGQDQLRIAGPFGQGAATITVRERFIHVLRADGSEETSARPEAVLQAQLGFPVPLQALSHWVLGLPEPSTVAEQKQDQWGRLQVLIQSGWQIHYQRYTRHPVVSYVLPEKIKVTRDKLQLKLIIDDWHLEV